MYKNPSIGIMRLMSEIDEFLELADLGRVLRFVQDSEEIFREIEVLGTAPVHS
jgi:hypothetical protein